MIGLGLGLLVTNAAAISGGVALLDGSESDGTNKLDAPTSAFSANWNTVDATFTDDIDTAPDGTTTGARLLEAATTNRHILYNVGYTITAGGVVTYSVYAKMIARRYLQISVANSSRLIVYYDLQAGIVTDTKLVAPDGSTAISATSCQAAVNGYYKCSLTGILDASTTQPYFQFGLSDVPTYGAPLAADSPSYLGNVANGAALWRPKVV